MGTFPFLNLGCAVTDLFKLLGTAVFKLIFADEAVMLATALTIRHAHGICEKLYFILMGQSAQNIKLIVQIVVKDNKTVIPFKLGFKLGDIGYLLAGGAGELNFRASVSYMLLKER